MSRAPLRWLRRCWPQKVRARLTLLYAALFLAGDESRLVMGAGLIVDGGLTDGR